MRLTFLRVNGFRVFAEESEISFPPSGLINITGAHQETGGSSGSGKTSVLQAINYALGTSSFAASRQQSWLTKTPMQVTLGMRTEDGTEEVVVHRGKRTAAELNGVEVAKGSTELNRWLQEYFQMDPKLLQVLTFRAQRAPALFMGLRPAEKRVFLGAVLGLEKFEAISKKLAEDIGALQKELGIKNGVLAATASLVKPGEPLTSLTWSGRVYSFDEASREAAAMGSRITKADDGLAAIRKQLDDVEAKSVTAFDHHEPIIASLRQQRDAVLKSMDARGAAAPEELRQAEALAGDRYNKLVAAHREALAAHQAANGEITDKQRQVAKLDQAVAAGQGKLVEIDKKLDGLRAKRCYVCGQDWAADDVLAATELAAAQQREVNETLRLTMKSVEADRAKASAALVEVAERITKLDAGITTYAEKLRAAQAAVRTFEKESADAAAVAYRAVSEEWLAKVAAAQEQQRLAVQAVTGERQRLNEVLKTLMAERKLEHDRCASLLAAVDALTRQNIANEVAQKLFRVQEEKRQQLLAEISGLESKLAEQQDLQTAVRAFIGAFSEEILTEIGTEANAMLAALPNVSGVGLRFTTETLTEAGARQEIKVVITAGKNDDIDGDSQLSGGQMTSVELAVDRAVSKVLRRRHGGQRLPSWLIFDESFNGYDAQTREACLEFLRTDVGEGQVFIVDHAAELREAFQSTIRVMATPTGSKISIES